MATTNPAFELHALFQFKQVDLAKAFQDEWRVVAAFLNNKDIRFVLENVTIDSPNEDNLIYINLEHSDDTILPIELMRGGQRIGLEDLLEITNVSLFRRGIFIKVSRIRVGEYILGSGNIIEFAEDENISNNTDRRVEAEYKPQKDWKEGGLSAW